METTDLISPPPPPDTADGRATQAPPPAGRFTGTRAMGRPKLGQVLLMQGSVTEEQLEAALDAQRATGERIGRVLVDEGIITEIQLVQALAGDVPEERILEIYNALRPGRADPRALFELADDIEQRYHAKRCAALVREAAG